MATARVARSAWVVSRGVLPSFGDVGAALRRALAGAVGTPPPPPAARAPRGGARGLAADVGAEFARRAALEKRLAEADTKRRKAEAYLEGKKKRPGGLAAAAEDAADLADRSVLPPWMAPPPATGLAGVAESRIAEAVAEGALRGLAGEGKPLPVRPEDEVDAAQALLNRTLRAAGYKPASVEAKEALDAARTKYNEALDALAASGLPPSQLQHGPAGARAREAHARLEVATRAFNAAVAQDKEQHGAGWPLNAARLPASLSDALRDRLGN